MATQFEILLAGDDEEHLAAVALAICDEIDRVEKLLSRFDPASEVSRINRTAAGKDVLLDHELCAILATCHAWWQRTRGAFDIVASQAATGPKRLGWEALVFQPQSRRLQFLNAAAQLDFGAYGKGYALDCVANLLATHEVTHARVHGGFSSILLRGTAPDGRPWRVTGPPGMALELTDLGNVAISTSVTFHEGESQSDIVDTTTGETLRTQRYCLAMADSAAEAEILSTSGLLLGPESLSARLADWTSGQGERIVKVYWPAGLPGEHALVTWPCQANDSTSP